VYKQHNSGMNQ